MFHSCQPSCTDSWPRKIPFMSIVEFPNLSMWLCFGSRVSLLALPGFAGTLLKQSCHSCAHNAHAREGQCSGLSPSNSTHVNMRAKAAANSGCSHYCSSLCLNSFFKSIPTQGRVKTPYGKPALKRVQISRHIFSWKRKADVTSICVMGHPRLAAADIKIVTSPG